MQFVVILQSLIMLQNCTGIGSADSWIVQERFGDVSVYAQFALNPEELAVNADLLRKQISDELELDIPPSPITLVLFSGKGEYQRFVSKHIPSGRGRRALFVHTDGVSAVYAYRSRYLTQDLRHELTHAWLRSAVDFLPLWMDEGLARYFENPDEPGDLSAIRWKTRLGWKPSLASLENLESAADMDETDYASSWAWVSFLLRESPSTRRELTSYLARISAGEVPEQFSRQLQVSMPDSKARLGRFFRSATVATVIPRHSDRQADRQANRQADREGPAETTVVPAGATNGL